MAGVVGNYKHQSVAQGGEDWEKRDNRQSTALEDQKQV